MKFTKKKYGWRFSVGNGFDSPFQFLIQHFSNKTTNEKPETRITLSFRTDFLMNLFKCNERIIILPF